MIRSARLPWQPGFPDFFDASAHLRTHKKNKGEGMRPIGPLVVLALAGAACLDSSSAQAEEERARHAEKPSAGRSIPDNGCAQCATGARAVTAPPARAASRVPEGQGVPDSGQSQSSYGSPAPDASFSPGGAHETGYWSSATSPGFTDLSAELDANGYAGYLGLGGGKGTAYYPSSSSSKFAWQLFLGGRVKYFGAEVEYSHLSTIPATVNSQFVDVTTETLSLSLLAYLPVTSNVDFFLRYGGVNWMVSANSSATGYLPVTSGFNWARGAGLEFRSGPLFLGVEKEIFRHVYQSSFYSFAGIRLGAYFD